MITGEIRSKVDRIWDTMWSGGISNPLSVIEQLTYLLFIKRLDELHTLKESKANRLKKPIEDPVFGEDEDHLRWSRFKQTAPEKMFSTVREEVFPFIKLLGTRSGDGDTEHSTYSQHMKDAIFMFPTAKLLSNIVDQLDSIDMADRDTKGDLYEYMLSKIASAGQNGQFRTPRHIIKFMVEMTSPTPHDTICDPACGTAGFLIATSEYLVNHFDGEIYKTDESRRRFKEDTFHGFDFDSTMLRIGSMNMLLHGIENPDIQYKDSLAQEDAESAGRFSLILANPPFSGSLDYESTAKDLLNVVRTKKTELLFLALFRRLLAIGGRAAVVVPAGVLESDGRAMTAARRMLIEDLRLEAVIKLPHWVFKPYASVDTSILIFAKGGETDYVWFYRVDNDGFADDALKTPLGRSDLEEVLALWRSRDEGLIESVPQKHRYVSVAEIRRNNYDLCPPMYLSGHEYPAGAKVVRLGTLFNVTKGTAPASSGLDEGKYDFITSSIKPRRANTFSFKGPAICIPTVSATGHGHASIKSIHLVEGEFEASSITAVLLPKNQDVPIVELYFYLLAHKDELLVPLMRGATNKSMNTDRLEGLLVPLLDTSSPEGEAIRELVDLRSKIKVAQGQLSELCSQYERGMDGLQSLKSLPRIC